MIILINNYLQILLGLQIRRRTMRPEKGLVLLHESSEKTMASMDIALDKISCIMVCFSEEYNNDDRVVYNLTHFRPWFFVSIPPEKDGKLELL